MRAIRNNQRSQCSLWASHRQPQISLRLSKELGTGRRVAEFFRLAKRINLFFQADWKKVWRSKSSKSLYLRYHEGSTHNKVTSWPFSFDLPWLFLPLQWVSSTLNCILHVYLIFWAPIWNQKKGTGKLSQPQYWALQVNSLQLFFVYSCSRLCERTESCKTRNAHKLCKSPKVWVRKLPFNASSNS